MKTTHHHYKVLLVLCTVLWGLSSFVAGQYYYFDASTSTAPYQQGCSEDLAVRINTETNPYGARAGLLRLLFDPVHFSYSTSAIASVIQTNLFLASTETFMNNTSPTASPSWVDPLVNTQLQIDRNNSTTDYIGSNGLYGTLKFVPLYNTSDYTGTFSIIYNGDTIRTTLSKAWGVNIIDAAHQNPFLTWSYHVLQHPCTYDTTSPAVAIPYPTNGSTKRSYLSGINLSLTDNAWSAAGVPYVWSGGVWTGNLRSITDQYGINLTSFNIWISWNGTGKYITGPMFAPAGDLAAVANGFTWQYLDKNYVMDINSPALFDYGIEKTITITGNVQDRNSNAVSFTRSFNAPVGPWLIPGSANPAWGNSLVLTTAPVLLWIQDDWAGVDSWSIIITLSWVNGTVYGPYTFTGSQLTLSGIAGSANQPDYAITISGHVIFPSSGSIQVHVYAEDMENNIDTISDYIFDTKPSCADLGCCQDVYLQTGSNSPILYPRFTLNISGGFNPSFVIDGNTGTVDCGTEWLGMTIYKWTEENSWAASYVSFFDLPNLFFSWVNVQALLSWHTIYLQKMFTIIIKAFPSNRVYQETNNANVGVLNFYDTNRVLVGTSSLVTLNSAGTGEVHLNIPVGTYYAVFKWQSQLASYISGAVMTESGGLLFDFTTGTDLYNTQQLNDGEDNGYRYQTAGDLKNTEGVYDFTINGNDISIVTMNGLEDGGINILDPRNLNGDIAINASDISVIGVNFEKNDPYLLDNNFFNW